MKIRQVPVAFASLLAFQALFSNQLASGSQDLLQYVNTLIGTSYYQNQFDVHDYGNTAPFAGPPFAHTPWTAQTRDSEDKCQSPYYHFDQYWQGMRRSHWMSGSCTIDYGSATIIPSLSANLRDALTAHRMDHSSEVSSPHYYRMNLAESSMTVEAASDIRSGIMRVTPSDKQEFFYLIFKASDTMYNQSSVNILPPQAYGEAEDKKMLVNSLTISSPVHRWYQSKGQHAEFSGHHYFETSRPACEFGIIEEYGNVLEGQSTGTSNSMGTVAAYLKFESSLGEVLVATGTSFVSTDKARKNLYAELAPAPVIDPDYIYMGKPGEEIIEVATIFDFDDLSKKVKGIWEERLGAIKAKPFVSTAKEVVSDAGEVISEGSVATDDKSQSQLVTFYSAIWHTQLLPRIVSDFDGEYLKFGDGVRSVERTDSRNGFTNYFDDFSMWDIFRAQVPLFNLVYTDNTRDMVISLLRKAQQGGWLPIFPAWNSYTDEMIGDHCTVLIADSFFKGILPLHDDTNNIFAESVKYVVKNALQIPSDEEYKMGKGRRALASYELHGFIPLEDEVLDSYHPRQQVSRTLEYSYDDYVVSQFMKLHADYLEFKYKQRKARIPNFNIHGHDRVIEESHERAASMKERSQNYRYVVDGLTTDPWYTAKTPFVNDKDYQHKSVDFVRGRHADLSWTETADSFDPSKYYTWLTETNVWQYSFSVLHDVEGLIQIYGGNEKFIAKLDKFFDEAWYNHGNEPDHHTLYLYAYVPGHAWRVQDRLPEIIRTQYGPTERSMSGNDDAGQMSAWLVMSSMGLYQVCPGCGGRSEYVLGLPLFAFMEVSLPSSGSQICNQSVLDNDQTCTFHQDKKTLLVETIRMNNLSTEKYIQMVTWNGCEYDCAFIPHAMIAEGGHLKVYLGAEPNKQWGGEGRKCMDSYFYPGDTALGYSHEGKTATC